MKYTGSKRLFAKHIIPVIIEYVDKYGYINDIKNWYEPFVGGANSIQEVPKYLPNVKLYGSDFNTHTIQALKLIRDKPLLIPRTNKEFTREDYYRVKSLPEHHLHGYVGNVLSFGGKWWGGWAHNKRGRDYVGEAWRSAIKQFSKLQGVELYVSDYHQQYKMNSIIYCDPPYADTTNGYKNKEFDSARFWNYIRALSESHFVFVSEYNAPPDFTMLWEKEVKTTLNNVNNSKYKTNIERLFVYNV